MDRDITNITRATTYLAYSINVLLVLILVVCLCSCFSSLIASSQPPVAYKNSCEPFTQGYSQFSSKYKSDSEYKHISLTSATDSQNSPSNLLIGSADRIIQKQSQNNVSNEIYKLNIKAYLPNLKGDVFSPDNSKLNTYALKDYKGYTLPFGLTTETNAKYTAHLYNKKTNTQIQLGELKLSGDKSYSLEYNSKEPNQFNDYQHLIVGITDNKNNKFLPLLYGKFY